MDYYPIKLQVAFFLTSVDFSSKLKIANLVRAKCGNLLEVDPLLLPLPPDAPPEFPHIVIRNDNNGWLFQMGPARFDLVIQLGPHQPLGDFTELTKTICKTGLDIWQGLRTEFSASANRIGLVTTTVTELENPTEVFRQRYLSTKNAEGSSECQLHILHKINAKGFTLNDWVRLLALPANEIWPSRFVFEIDINSIPEQPVKIDETVARSFFAIADELTKQGINSYIVG